MPARWPVRCRNSNRAAGPDSTADMTGRATTSRTPLPDRSLARKQCPPAPAGSRSLPAAWRAGCYPPGPRPSPAAWSRPAGATTAACRSPAPGCEGAAPRRTRPPAASRTHNQVAATRSDCCSWSPAQPGTAPGISRSGPTAGLPGPLPTRRRTATCVPGPPPSAPLRRHQAGTSRPSGFGSAGRRGRAQ